MSMCLCAFTFVLTLVHSNICLISVSICVRIFAYRTALMTNLRVGIISSIRISGGKPFSSGVGSGSPAVSTRKNQQLIHMDLSNISESIFICNKYYI